MYYLMLLCFPLSLHLITQYLYTNKILLVLAIMNTLSFGNCLLCPLCELLEALLEIWEEEK